MPLDETQVKEAEKDFRQEGDRNVACDQLPHGAGGSPRSDVLIDICGRFEKEVAELGFNLEHEDMDRLLVMSRRYFQLMVATANTMAKETDEVLGVLSHAEGRNRLLDRDRRGAQSRGWAGECQRAAKFPGGGFSRSHQGQARGERDLYEAFSIQL